MAKTCKKNVKQLKTNRYILKFKPTNLLKSNYNFQLSDRIQNPDHFNRTKI